MAILQLSRITHRKGLSENLPQLAGAEFGWVLDDRKLFIGNGTIVDGAPLIGNTEILTEFSNILDISSGYTYKGADAGYVVSTGATEDVVRSLQSKYDDFASVKDFGAIGNGLDDDTAAINRALYELFCRFPNPQIRRSLYFPAGVYKVTGTINIPPHAKLWGEGLTSSIISFDDAVTVNAVDIVVGTRYAISTISGSNFITVGAASNTVDVVFVATAGAAGGTGTVREVPEHVVETSDSLQQTGLDIGAGGAEAPTGIEMSNMSVYTTEENTPLKLDSVTNSGFYYLGLRGPNTDATAIGYSTSAIEIGSSVSPTHDITISKLDTFGTTYGLRVAGEARGVVLENSGLDFHYQGVHIHNPTIDATGTVAATRYKIISVGTTDFTAIGADFNRIGITFTASGAGAGTGEVISMDYPGPTGVIISRNIFDNIAHEGVHFHNTLFNSSGYNVFYNVGNDLGSTAVTPVIHMETDQCVSLGDLFEREDESIFPRIDLKGNGGIAFDGTHSIHLGSYERQVGIEAVLTDNTAVAESVFEFDSSDAIAYKLDYNIERGTEARMGSILIADNTVTVTYNDEFQESADLGVVLDIIHSGANANTELQFTATNTGADATINYSIVRLD